jgi:hypothetical protein
MRNSWDACCQRNNIAMRDSLTALGRGSTIVGLLFVAAGAKGEHPRLLIVGQILIGIGIIGLIVHLSTQQRK